MRAKQRVAAEAKEEREKAKASGATQSQLKKQRKAERAIEKGKERAEEAGPVPEVVEGEPVQEGKGKRAREERERKRGTIPYKLGEKILLIGEGMSPLPTCWDTKLTVGDRKLLICALAAHD